MFASSFVCLSVCLSIVNVMDVHPMSGQSTMLHINLRGGIKNPGSANKYTNNDQLIYLIVRKIIKIIATRCHILRLKCTTFDSSVSASEMTYIVSSGALNSTHLLTYSCRNVFFLAFHHTIPVIICNTRLHSRQISLAVR